METLGHKKLSDSDFNALMVGLDADESGEVTYDEFMEVRTANANEVLIAMLCVILHDCDVWRSAAFVWLAANPNLRRPLSLSLSLSLLCCCGCCFAPAPCLHVILSCTVVE